MILFWQFSEDEKSGLKEILRGCWLAVQSWKKWCSSKFRGGQSSMSGQIHLFSCIFQFYSPKFQNFSQRISEFSCLNGWEPAFFNNVHPTHSLFCSLLIHLFNHLSLIYMGVPKIGNIDICRFWNSFWFVLMIYDLLSALARAGNRNVKQLAAEQNSQIQLMWQRRPGAQNIEWYSIIII